MNGTFELFRPEVFFDFRYPFRCRVKILVVTDSSSGGFGEAAGFHLGQILKILATDPWPHVTFDVTRAHRQTSPEAGVIDGLRFHAHDLTQYDQIWLFGIERTFDPLTPQELRALSQFMDGGGGVFATGDHENLGQAMCAEVPRVRSMRRWYHPNPGPGGEPVAPDQVGAARHDTLVDPAGAPGPDQSDKVPQTIRPRLYSRIASTGIIRRIARFPHPVLCGPSGVIDFLPDHMHEGLCEVPANLSNAFTFDGYTTTEYPTNSAGHQERPEVIAWADSHGTNATDFGVLGAYDGHRVGVGRVLVDATWHHWFNINLVGFLAATDPASPSFDPAVVPQWEEIKAYFRNVGVWLARPGMQSCLRNGGWLLASRYYDILITYRPLDRVRDHLEYYWQVGVFARDALGRLASQCQSYIWRIDILEWVEFIPFDPWEQLRPEKVLDPPPWLELEQLELVALGSAIDAVLHRFGREEDLQALVERRGEEIHEVARMGAARGVGEYVQRFREGAARLDELAERAAKYGGGLKGFDARAR